MRNIFLLFACFLLVSAIAQADMTQNGRQPRPWDQAVSSVKLQSGGTDYTDNTTVFANLAVTGNNATGNPGYITMTAVDGNGKIIDYYLWMDATTSTYGTIGALKFASFPLLTSSGAYAASFPYGDWRAYTGFTSNFTVTGSTVK